jgi:hypothetical protein
VKNHLRLLGAFFVACLLALLLVARRFGAVVSAILFVILLPGLAAAADASTSIDLAPILVQYVLPFAFSVLAMVGSLALLWLRKRLGMAADDQNAGKLEDAMRNGLAFAQSQLQATVAAGGPMNLQLKNQILSIAAKYAADHVPDAMKALSVGEDLLKQKLEARLSLNTTPPDQSMAVPTPPAQPAPAVATAIAAPAA